MRVTIQAPIDTVNEQPPGIQILGSIERDDIRVPASSLGFFLRETHALLRHSSAATVRLPTGSASSGRSARGGVNCPRFRRGRSA